MVLFPYLHMAKIRFTLIWVRIGKKQSKLIIAERREKKSRD